MNPSEHLPARLAEIVEDFRLCEGREKLELLLQYAESLPPLPGWLQGREMEMEAVPECMTPVAVAAEIHDGRMRFHFKVPEESPTVRGFAAIIAGGLEGASPEEVLNLPADFYLAMGLQEVLTSQRMNGMSAIVAHIKRLAVEQIR
ncbi:MAG TPA: cysteine desulfuration protein SufE [Anaerolinea thermolimosa]|uniref:Cysteine desulfuration protein SufE n=1 Tax=Anaerolinea thermolimosa TaxID=229919 RepID=A0A3D1JJG7_9CHLR|nr:cysteine desulfuration protein SufE [Anaerolinea thermolimosa]